MKPIFTKPAPITKSLWLCLCLLFTVPVFAQTPTVLTLKASNVSSTETPEGGANISISATLNGAVNANGTNCTVSFEYGNTTSYGNTIAAGTVTGSADNSVGAGVTINYTATGPQERLIHYRLKVTNEYGTYYGRDFIATPIDPTRNIFISAPCSDSETMASFDLQNNNSFDITVNYTAGASYTGSVIIGSQQVQQVFVGKGSIGSFAYHYTLFRQVVTNDQLCSETQLPKQNIFMTATGKIASDKMMYRIENSNSSSVNIETTCGSSNYTYTIAPQSVAYFAGPIAEAQIGISGEPFAISSPSGGYAYEGMAWLSVTPLSTTATTANFELYNRDDATHTFVMRNAGGTENSYTLAAYESRTVTLANENWDVYTTIWDPTGMYYGYSHHRIYTGPAFGDATSFYNGLLKVATAIPGSSITASVTPATIASSTSLTLNGVISNSAFANTDVDYHFIYGTDPNNLNQSTSTQSGTVPASGSLNVNTAITGLTEGTLYYYKLVTGEITSPARKIFLSTAIPTTNLKLHLRSDLAVTSASSAVSAWGDLSGWNNDASQGTSGNQPIVAESAINAKPALSFNGTTSKLTLPTSTSLGIQSNPYELFIVAKSSSGNVQFLIAGGAYEQFEYHLNGAAGARFIPTTLTYIDKSTTGSYTNGSAHLFSARASATGGAVRVDGIDGVTSGSNILSSNNSNLLLGARSDGTYCFNGDLAEVIIYNRILTESERDSVEQYLDNRYQTDYNQKLEYISTSFTVAEDTLLAGLLATDADGDLLSYTILRNGQNGTAHTQHDSLFYMPAPDFNGNDSLHITVSDGLLSDTAWVYITVTPVNDAPVARDTLVEAMVATATTIDLPVSDIDGTISAVLLHREPVNGATTVSGTSLTYTSDAGFSGNDTIAWYARDNEGAFSDTAMLVIHVNPSEIAVDLSVSDTTVVDGTEVCFNAQNEITVAGSSTVTVENNATANFIAGTSIRFLPGFHAEAGSYVHGWITEDASFCDVSGGSSIVILPEMKSHDLNIPNEKQNILGEFQVKIFPNPNNGQFRITLSGAQMNQSEVKVYNQLGKLVYSKKLFFQSDVEIAINNATPGLYLVKTTSGKNITTRKIIIN